MQKHLLTLYWCFILLSSSSFALVDEENASANQTATLLTVQQQNTSFVNLFSEWGYWCKVMDKTTCIVENVNDVSNLKPDLIKINGVVGEYYLVNNVFSFNAFLNN